MLIILHNKNVINVEILTLKYVELVFGNWKGQVGKTRVN